jgi:hypothetical protein
MKLLNLFTLITLFFNRSASLVPVKKICKDCSHFIGDKMECRKFDNTNIITGKVTYDSAHSVRADEKKCGKDGILFEENNFKLITVPYYFVKDNWIVYSIPFSILASFYFYFYITLLH